MFDPIARLRSQTMVALLGALALAACDGGGPAGPGGDEGDDDEVELGTTSSALAADRTVTILPWSGTADARAPGAPTSVGLTQGSGPLTWLNGACYYAVQNITGRAGDPLVPSSPVPAGWNTCTDARLPIGGGFGETAPMSALQMAVFAGCMGTYALSIAEATSSYYMTHADPSWNPMSVGVSTPAGHIVDATIAPSSTSDRASWALLAVDLFRESAEAASLLLSDPACTPAALRATYSSSGNPTVVVDWGEEIAVQLAESLANGVEAADKAAKYLHASAQAKNATRGDRAKYRSIAWRDPYDSLLRAASAYVSVPATLYNQKNDAGTVTAQGTYPVVTSFLSTDPQERAADLLRTYRVDPRAAGGGRSRATIAADISAQLNRDYRGAFEGAGAALLQAMGIADEDLQRAMNRLVQEQAVLGRPWRSYTENGVTQVFGMDKTSEPASPYYLYNITEGALPPATWDGNAPSVTYARRGVFHAMDYALYNLRLMSEKADYSGYSAATRRMVKSARAFAKQYVQGHVTVITCDSNCDAGGYSPNQDGVLDAMKVRVVGAEQAPLPASVTAEQIASAIASLRDDYDLWLGEEGLQCAVEGVTPRGEPCDPADYQFTERVTFDNAALTVPSSRYPSFAITLMDRPAGPNSDQDPFRTSPRGRVYVTRVERAGVEPVVKVRNVPVASFVMYVPPGPGWDHRLIPMSTGLADALANTLAVDPLAADETAQFCGHTNLPRNIKLGLESELLQSRGNVQDNAVEESWAYYLSQAKDAAKEADLIGNDLVEQGLQMDMRAEAARNELEDLCGGVVNVGDLRTAACGTDTSTCDIMKYLEDASPEENPDLASLRQCLGITEIGSATLGPYPVCTWQYRDLAPCECPKGAAAAGCPGRRPSDEEATAWLKQGTGYFSGCYAPIYEKAYNNAHKKASDFEPGDCEQLFVPPQTGGVSRAGLSFKVMKNKLALTSPIGKVEEPPPYACEYLAGLRSLSESQLKAELAKQDIKLGTTLAQFRSVAKRLEVRRSDLNFVSLALDDGDWGMNVTGVVDDPFGAKSTFPCGPSDKLTEDYCASVGAGSLLCGMDCGAPSSTTQTRIDRMQDSGERLARAVEFMRAVTGSGMEGIEVALWPRKGGDIDYDWDMELADDWDLRASGAFPDCPGSDSWCDFAVTPADLFPRAGEVERLATLVRSRKFTTSSRCDPLKAARNGILPGSDYCRAEGTGDKERPAIEMVEPYHVSWVDKGDAAEKWVSIREVCIPGDQAPFESYVYPFNYDSYNSSALPWNQQRLPPPCEQGRLVGDRYMTFFDAGGLVTWPTMAKNEVTKFWTSDLERKLRTALTRTRSEELARIESRASGYEVGDRTGIRRSSVVLSNYTHQNMLDAFELACMASSPSYAKVECGHLDDEFGGLDDIAKMKGTLNCRAKGIARVMDTMMLQDVPVPLITALQQQSTAALYPTFQGQYATTVAKLYGSIMAIGTAYNTLSSDMAAMGPIFESAEAQIKSIGYKKDANVEQGMMNMQLANNECGRARQQIAVAAARGALSGAAQGSQGWFPVVGGLVGAGIGASVEIAGASIDSNAACDARDIQKKHTNIINDLTNKAANADVVVVIQSTALALNDRHASMEAASNAMKTAYADAQAALAELAAQRNAARRAAANVLMLDNDDAGHQFQVNTVMRARMNTLRVQYERAQAYAIRMAYLARRAIEQKIGIDLNDLGDDVGWVAAPRSWADSICSLSGINYDEIREGTDKVGAEPYNYADEYVGNYVDRLEEFITAYENSYVSQTGRDTALVSVRDELLNVRNNACEIDGVNELLQSAESLNVAPPGMDEDDARDYAPEPVWESPTNAGGTYVSAAAEPDESPFISYTKNAAGVWIPATVPGNGTDAPSWGKYGNIVKAVRLSPTADTASVVSGADAPPVPPATGLAYWYRADACDPTAASACQDLSGSGRHAPAATGAVTLLPSGIGGRPTLALAQDSYVTIPTSTADEYADWTLSTVVRGPSSGYGYSWQASVARSDGRLASNYLLVGSSWVIFNSSQDDRNNAGPTVQLQAGGRFAPQGRLSDGDIITVRGGAQGLELYVNGALRGKHPRAAAPFNLRGQIAFANGVGEMHWAESMAYGRWLGDAELDLLHRYLAGRYAKNLKAPASWFSADVMEELRRTGTSQSTGYQFTDGELRDAATGRPFQTWDNPNVITTQPVVPFSGGHYALDFHQQQAFAPELFSYVWDHTAGVGGRVEDFANGEYSATAVVNADPGALSRLLQLDTWLPEAGVADSRGLELDCTAGAAVRVWLGSTGAVRGAPSGTLNCSAPFVVTLRGSESRGTTDVFVNGALVLSDPTFERFSGRLHIGRTAVGHFTGAIADVQLHMNNMSDADLVALHAQLGAKFAIPVAAASGGSGAVTGLPRYQQQVNLTSGTYLLSWYQRDNEDPLPRTSPTDPFVPGAPVAPLTVRVEDWNGDAIVATPQAPVEVERWLNPEWRRHSVSFTVQQGTDGVIAWEVPAAAAATGGVLFAAPQLELVDDLASTSPSALFPTDDDYLIPAGVCDDKDGSQFRAQYWGYGCEHYCPPELGSNCVEIASDPTNLPKRCYYELKFNLSQGGIEKGEQLSQGGFSAGNFNYRFEDIAVNVVGTAVKDCENSQTPSSCYANNFLQYTLRQDGPFVVRNYLGRKYEAPLYPGRIQQGKALLAERYLTNPLSSADDQLLKRYWDNELVGRPMDGSYTLRIYDTPELNWEALQDVQLLVNYRYWTRLN